MKKWKDLSDKEKKVTMALILFYSRESEIYERNFAFCETNDDIQGELGSLQEIEELEEEIGEKYFIKSIDKFTECSIEELNQIFGGDLGYFGYNEDEAESYIDFLVDNNIGRFYTCNLCNKFTIISKCGDVESLINHFLENHSLAIEKLLNKS